MVEPIWTRDYPKCPDCGCEKAITRAALLELGIKEFGSARKVVVPLKQPLLAAVTIPALLFHFDHCWDCGREHLTKVDRLDAPVSIQAKPPGMPPDFPGSFPRG